MRGVIAELSVFQPLQASCGAVVEISSGQQPFDRMDNEVQIVEARTKRR